jgi:hypothetical protein
MLNASITKTLKIEALEVIYGSHMLEDIPADEHEAAYDVISTTMKSEYKGESIQPNGDFVSALDEVQPNLLVEVFIALKSQVEAALSGFIVTGRSEDTDPQSDIVQAKDEIEAEEIWLKARIAEIKADEDEAGKEYDVVIYSTVRLADKVG